VGTKGTRLQVGVLIDAPPERVWAAIEDVGSHVRWMDDAVAIRFTTEHTSGVGAAYVCDTRIGPFSLGDRMEITEWAPGQAMGVRHVGVVTGSGRFTLEPAGSGPGRRTRFAWDETLRFPWWLGGALGAAAARPVLRRIWARNLRHLKRLVEAEEEKEEKPADPV
jgi:uncharacterized protein YndB with AHSA1/START domain